MCGVLEKSGHFCIKEPPNINLPWSKQGDKTPVLDDGSLKTVIFSLRDTFQRARNTCRAFTLFWNYLKIEWINSGLGNALQSWNSMTTYVWFNPLLICFCKGKKIQKHWVRFSPLSFLACIPALGWRCHGNTEKWSFLKGHFLHEIATRSKLAA